MGSFSACWTVEPRAMLSAIATGMSTSVRVADTGIAAEPTRLRLARKPATARPVRVGHVPMRPDARPWDGPRRPYRRRAPAHSVGDDDGGRTRTTTNRPADGAARPPDAARGAAARGVDRGGALAPRGPHRSRRPSLSGGLTPTRRYARVPTRLADGDDPAAPRERIRGDGIHRRSEPRGWRDARAADSCLSQRSR